MYIHNYNLEPIPYQIEANWQGGELFDYYFINFKLLYSSFFLFLFGHKYISISRLLSAEYLTFLYRHLKEWRKIPQWSFSCCLALLLPLSDFQGEIPDLIEANVLTNQLQTGQIDMPPVLSAVNDSGVITVTHEEGLQDDDDDNDGDNVVDAKKVQDIHSHRVEYYNSKCHKETQTELSAVSYDYHVAIKPSKEKWEESA